MENYLDIKELFTKYLDNSISREEYDRLLAHLGKHQDDGELQELVMDAMSGDMHEKDQVELNKVVSSVVVRLREKLQPRKTIPLRRYLPYAAALFLFFTAGISYYIMTRYNGKDAVQIAKVLDVDPASSGATLTLANGKRIALKGVSSGAVTSGQGIEVSKTKDGELVYTVKGSSLDLNSDINTLSTANGEKYQIVLSDGTKVWLNAATTLQYSANLKAGANRQVKLLGGEAYFEVAKDKSHPFIVETPSQQVEVLGTHFNINAYPDENVVKTTLLEGSVKVSQSNSQSFKVLKPGEQAFSQNGAIQVLSADTEQAVAWKNGDFVFEGEDLKTVMRQVSRWYDVDVEYKGNVNVNGIFSSFPRTLKLSQLLKALEANQGIHFKMEGRRILVMP